MKRKKIIALLMACVMVLALGACGNSAANNNSNNNNNSSSNNSADTSTTDTNNDSTETDSNTDSTSEAADLSDIIPTETVNLVAYTQLANYSGEQIGWAADLLLEKFNVKLTIINEADGTFDTRMSSGDLGDIVVFGSDGTQYLSAVEAGMLLDWEDDYILQDYGTYINDNMQTALEKNRGLSGGKVYGFGHNVASSSSEHEAFFYYPDIRWDLYAKLGYPEVNTLEDFADLLEQMVALEPTSDSGKKTYGASMFADWDGDMAMFVKATGALYGYDEFGFGLYDTKTQTYEDCLKPDGMYLRSLKFYNTLYQKGLLDPDSMTQTFNDMIEDYQTGSAFFNIFNWMASSVYNTPEHLAEGKVMKPLAAADQKNLVYGLNIFGENRIWSIGSKTHYPELCMAIINWLSTPEGVMDSLYGPRGLTWDYDSDGNPYLTELGIACQQNDETRLEYGNSNGTFKDGILKINNTTWNTDSVNPETNGETYNWLFWNSTQNVLESSEIENDWKKFTGYNNSDEYLIGDGHVSINIGSTFSMAPRDNELETVWQQIATCIKAGSWNAIYAKSDAEFNSVVEAMTQEAMAYGYDKCVEYTSEQAEIRKALENEVKNNN